EPSKDRRVETIACSVLFAVQVGSKLGKGKFGIVYKAKCKLSKRTVAIKMIYKVRRF
ncbi:unnamed protein product, partial [Hapterophycus canaliculatus]